MNGTGLNRSQGILSAATTVAAAALLALSTSGCSTLRSALALDKDQGAPGPIHNPFGSYYSGAPNEQAPPMVLRTKKGDRSVEVEIPRGGQEISDFVIPVSPAFRDGRGGRSLASVDGAGAPAEADMDESYRERRPTIADREITSNMPHGSFEDESKRHEIEQGLGLVTADNETPEHDGSYLASIDHIKQLYRMSRYEAALIETDEMIRTYQTDPRLYEMRGTLLDRVGRTELALKSWNQALRFEPGNAALRKFVDRRQKAQNRGVAGK